MPEEKRYANETPAAFKKWKKKTGPARTAANKRAKGSKKKTRRGYGG
tara:strand:+ start:268 stop:408 length:141 start_codon:yes stop_codon:yes gene_type:complete